VDGRVKRRQDVSVEALVAGDGWPADLVCRHVGLGRAALGGSEALAEDANSGNGVAGSCGEGVGAMTLLVTWGVKGGVEWPRRRFVALVEVPCSDQLPAYAFNIFNLMCSIQNIQVYHNRLV